MGGEGSGGGVMEVDGKWGGVGVVGGGDAPPPGYFI